MSINNSNDYKWVNELGKSLISKVEFSVNDETVWSYDYKEEKKWEKELLDLWLALSKKICKYCNEKIKKNSFEKFKKHHNKCPTKKKLKKMLLKNLCLDMMLIIFDFI